MSEPEQGRVADAERRVADARRSGSTGGADVAAALLELSAALDRADRTDDAFAAARDGIQELSPSFLAGPARLAAPMRAIVAQYVALAGRSGATTDAALLAPIAQALADLDRRTDAEDD